MTIRPWWLRAQFLDLFGRALDLLARRHQHGAVLQRPAVVLHMGDLDTGCAERERELDHVGDALDIGAVHHRIDGERQVEPHHLGGERALLRERAAIAGDMVGGLRRYVLDRDLHVIETGIGQQARASCR